MHFCHVSLLSHQVSHLPNAFIQSFLFIRRSFRDVTTWAGESQAAGRGEFSTHTNDEDPRVNSSGTPLSSFRRTAVSEEF
ncbi:hypothetical protein TNIN_106671 [Trichonephila inaurata madagascariensis]|uniref:Uncharacterized protein n=1 Tax=Trichonephila inaurata madagascariensis TaxID=2747483 RepID=A0A8X6XR23_9ARAC|nr:hypothetical protein TNIN_106671 [Trichonephila inaurata madagascariensis]